MKNKVIVDLFWASSCSRCKKAKLELRDAIQLHKSNRLCYREIDVLEEIDYAVEVGVSRTPSIAINGKLIFSSLPRIKHFIAALEQALVETQ